MTMVYEKALRLSPASKQLSSTGETVNLMGTDTQRVFDLLLFFHWLWLGPVVIVVILVLLIIEIGWAAVAGVVVMFTILPVQGVVAKKIGLKRSEMLKSTDERVKTITEILTGIRVVKFYAWEEPFADRVQKTRVKEVASLRSFVLLKMFNLTVCAAFQPTACRLHLLEHDGVVVCLGRSSSCGLWSPRWPCSACTRHWAVMLLSLWCSPCCRLSTRCAFRSPSSPWHLER